MFIELRVTVIFQKTELKKSQYFRPFSQILVLLYPFSQLHKVKSTGECVGTVYLYYL